MQGKKVLHFLRFLSLAQIVGSGRRARVLFLFQKKQKVTFPALLPKARHPSRRDKNTGGKTPPASFPRFSGGEKSAPSYLISA